MAVAAKAAGALVFGGAAEAALPGPVRLRGEATTPGQEETVTLGVGACARERMRNHPNEEDRWPADRRRDAAGPRLLNETRTGPSPRKGGPTILRGNADGS
jgi:hypothetical protein